MNQGTAIIASDAVGAAAGGLVRDGRNGLIVPAGDAGALARRAARRSPPTARAAPRSARPGARTSRAYTFDAWAGAFAQALQRFCFAAADGW